jgi:hypothetical protein
MLNFAQGDDMTIGVYYEKFTTRMSIFERQGCLFVNQYLLDTETVILYPGQTYDALTSDEKARTQKVPRDKYLGVLFLMRSGKRYQQLQNCWRRRLEQSRHPPQPLDRVKHTCPVSAAVGVDGTR